VEAPRPLIKTAEVLPLQFLIHFFPCQAGSKFFFFFFKFEYLYFHVTHFWNFRWVFFLEGIGTVMVALFAFCYLPGSLETASFLTPEEREFAG
jgi:hypothetical protein